MMNMAEPEIEDIVFAHRIENWRRWCIQRGLYCTRVGSAEGGYSGPQGNGHPTGWGDWEDAVPAPAPVRIVIDVPDAVEVNRAFVRLAMLAPRQAHILKVLLFRDYWRPQWQAQKLGMHHTELGEALYRAKIMLCNQVSMC